MTEVATNRPIMKKSLTVLRDQRILAFKNSLPSKIETIRAEVAHRFQAERSELNVYEGETVYCEQSFDLTKDWSVSFDYQYVSGAAGDWNNIFAFGSHISFGDDDRPATAVGFTSNRSNAPFPIFSWGNTNIQNDWHSYKLIYTSDDNRTVLFIDDELKAEHSYDYTSNVEGFYFSGGGCRHTILCKLKNIMIKAYEVNANIPSTAEYPFVDSTIHLNFENGDFVENFRVQTFVDNLNVELGDYFSVVNDEPYFDGNRFQADVFSGEFKRTIFDIDFNIETAIRKATIAELRDELHEYLLNCDHKRADLQPYDEKILLDINRGHWDLFEPAREGDIEIDLPQNETLVARPPQLDVRLHGLCAIDFGTKSTIVVCRDRDERMLRIGKGDYSKIPTMNDFENPTVIELRDINSFLDAYRARVGRPFTEWNQVTVSHQAAEAIFKAGVSSSVYNSVFNELKQWAKDEQSYHILKDLRGVTQDIKPYLETQSIDGGDFDPIELYAYYLGLYINNMHHQIYLDYIMSFPVNYKVDVRERIRASFERGLKKSLPPALQADEGMMKRFRVYLGASEPAAYAISALECFKLEPKAVGEKVAYGVFDFGGGTTDFDFGIEYIPENRKSNFVIDQFGFNGDVLLGGENILELLAYEVYKDNFDAMRKNKIPFALPAGCELFAGAEALVSRTKDASSHMNNRILAEELRPIWERADGYKNFGQAPRAVRLFSKEMNNGSYTFAVELNINVNKLDDCIRARIQTGVENFFQSMYSAFKGKEVYPIHIFLAGNSCKSPVVRELFDEFIAKEQKAIEASAQSKTGKSADASGTFILHAPLGEPQSEEAPAPEEPIEEEPIEGAQPSEQTPKLDMELDRRRTGKTGVAFGLLRCRKGGKDVKINNKNDAGGNPIFQYFLGDAGADGKTFTVKIGRGVGYGDWAYFTGADEPDFEIYYTTIPRAAQNRSPIEKVSMLHCVLDDADVIDDDAVGIYIRKVDPNTIEYAVGAAEDFAKEFEGKIYREKLS